MRFRRLHPSLRLLAAVLAWLLLPAALVTAVAERRRLAERVLVPYPIESALSGIMRREDRMWYRRTFTVPSSWQVGKANRLLLHFGAVDYDATVYVNGKEVAHHLGGYNAFSADVTDARWSTSTRAIPRSSAGSRSTRAGANSTRSASRARSRHGTPRGRSTRTAA